MDFNRTYRGSHLAIYTYIKSLCCALEVNTMLCQLRLETLKLVIFIIGLRVPPPWSPRIFHVLSASCGQCLPTVWKRNSLFFIIDGYIQALAISWRNVIILHFNEKRRPFRGGKTQGSHLRFPASGGGLLQPASDSASGVTSLGEVVPCPAAAQGPQWRCTPRGHVESPRGPSRRSRI